MIERWLANELIGLSSFDLMMTTLRVENVATESRLNMFELIFKIVWDIGNGMKMDLPSELKK
jgi:hypothetical protein